MKRVFPTLCLALALLASMPSASRAEDTSEKVDARYAGYDKEVYVKGGSTGLVWLLWIVLTAVTVGVMFKSGNRTHLD